LLIIVETVFKGTSFGQTKNQKSDNVFDLLHPAFKSFRVLSRLFTQL